MNGKKLHLPIQLLTIVFEQFVAHDLSANKQPILIPLWATGWNEADDEFRDFLIVPPTVL